MSDNHKIVQAEVVEIQKSNGEQKLHPLIIALAERKISPDDMSKIMDLQERHEKSEAKKAFDRDMVLLKGSMPAIIDKDKITDFTGKKGRVRYTFASLAHIIEQVEPYLSQYNFSLSWIPTTTERGVTVKCRLTHAEGHYEETSMSAPFDNSGSKNSIQAIGSTQSYLERYTASALLGIVSRDMPDIDDQPPPDDIVNTDRNLEAIAVLKREGIELSDAQAHLQKDFQNWTAADLTELGKYIRNIRAAKEAEKG